MTYLFPSIEIVYTKRKRIIKFAAIIQNSNLVHLLNQFFAAYLSS
jgi:hypothetical protein